MEISEMNLTEVNERLAALDEEVRSMEEVADIEKATEEKRALLDRKKELEDHEARMADAQAINENRATEAVVEERGETMEVRENMENIEMRNSLEYGRAFLHGNVSECRALLSGNVSTGVVAVPENLETEIQNAWEECELLSHAKQTTFKGNVKVGFEYSATGAAVHVEGTEAPEEETLIWGYVELKAENIKKWITVSDEAIENTTLDTLNEIYKEIAQRIVEEAEEIAIGKIVAAPAASTQTAVGVPVYTAATADVDTVTNAAAELSGKAKNLFVILNRRTEATFKSAAKKAHYGVDPFDGIERIHTDALKAYKDAQTGDTYAIIGDMSGFQVNRPNGNEVVLKVDDLSLAEKDLVKVVGRQLAGMGIVAPGRFVKIVK